METCSNSEKHTVQAGRVINLEIAQCPHFGSCGGCSIQHLSPSDQLTKKHNLVLAHLDGLSFQILPILPSPDRWFYRNKMEFSFGDQRDIDIYATPRDRAYPPLAADFAEKNKVHVGLHPKGRFSLVIPTPECQLLSPESQTITQIISDWATEHKIPNYVRPKHQGVLRHLVIREGKNTGERLVKLVATSSVDHLEDLASRIKHSGIPVTTFFIEFHDGLSDVAQGTRQYVFWGDGAIHERVDRCLLRVPSQSFMQTNTHASEKMVQLLRSWWAEDRAKDNSNLCDLYCGVGTIGINLASDFDQVLGIEMDPHAIEEATSNARLNGCTNLTFKRGRVEDQLNDLRLFLKQGSLLIVDPPRNGLHPSVVEAILELMPSTIYYVSCNPESLGRDLRRLGSKYTILDVQPMDFFPHTDHVETAVRLKRTSL